MYKLIQVDQICTVAKTLSQGSTRKYGHLTCQQNSPWRADPGPGGGAQLPGFLGGHLLVTVQGLLESLASLVSVLRRAGSPAQHGTWRVP